MSTAPDQAAELRRRAAAGRARLPRLPAIAITGGKGGVGKTCVAVNLAVHLKRLGKRPLLVDCDLGLANADALLGVNPGRNLFEVVHQGMPARDAIVATASGVDLLPAASGVEELVGLDGGRLRSLLLELQRTATDYDLLVLDTAAGIGREVTLMVAAATVVVVVVTPEPTSLTDAYALIKVVEKAWPGHDMRIFVNQAEDLDEATRVASRLRTVARSYLGRDLATIGWMPRDRAVRDSIHKRTPFALGNGPAALQLRATAQRLKGEDLTPKRDPGRD